MLWSLAVLLVVLAGWRFAYLPLAKSYAATRAQLKTSQAALAQARIKVAALPAQKERTEAAKRKYDDAAARFEAELTDGGMVVELGLAAQQDGVRITRWDPQEPVRRPDYVELPVKAEMTGTYAGILSFLNGLETYAIEPNLEDVRQLDLSVPSGTSSTQSQPQPPDTGTAGPQTLDAKLVLVFYSLPAPVEGLARTQAGAWSKGRSDPFAVAPLVSPYPGVIPQAAPSPSTSGSGLPANGQSVPTGPPPAWLKALLSGAEQQGTAGTSSGSGTTAAHQ